MNGVTRQKIIDLCHQNDIGVFQKNFSLYETYSADEAFVTGTFGALTPVCEIDGKVIGKEKGSGPVTTKLQEFYRDLIASL